MIDRVEGRDRGEEELGERPNRQNWVVGEGKWGEGLCATKQKHQSGQQAGEKEKVWREAVGKVLGWGTGPLRAPRGWGRNQVEELRGG